MDQYNKTQIDRPLSQLASANSDSLRAAQRLFAQLIGRDNQEEAIDYAIDAFTQLNVPQRIQLLQEVQLHLVQDRYPCLAFENNARFLTHALDRLAAEIARTEEVHDTGALGWLRRIRAEVQRKPAHGSPEHVGEVLTMVGEIQAAVRSVSIEPRELRLSARFDSFLDVLTDNELALIISFVADIRNIRACRDRFTAVADQDYIDQKLGIKEGDLATLGFPNFSKDLHAYLRPHGDIVGEIGKMDFVELSLLMNLISDFRSRKFRQGRVNE